VENIFLTHPWLREWWDVFGINHELWTLLAHSDEELVGILPLVLERGRDGTRRLMFMGGGRVMPSQLDLIARPSDREPLARAFWWYLWGHRPEWDVVDLDGVLGNSPLSEVLTTEARARGLPVHADSPQHSPYALLPASFEEYLESRGSGAVKELHYQQRRLGRDLPNARFGRVKTQMELEVVFDALVRLHQARWTHRGRAGSFADPLFTAFHRAAAHMGLAHDMLRLYYLEIENTIAAVYYCYRTGSHIFYYGTGFDERWARYSVGILLLAYVLEQSIQEGVREFDFLQGEEDYKSHWATGIREECRIRIAGPHLRGQLAWARQQSTENLLGFAKKYVDRNTRHRMREWLERTQRIFF
jgi:CelD/BcsL family acetyltransferase involved in cellulose biosynthesis